MEKRNIGVFVLFIATALFAFMNGNNGGVVHAAEKELKIYNLAPLSGTFSNNGKYYEMGSLLAIKEAGKVMGQNVKLISIDSESNPGKSARKTKEAIGQDKAKFFTGASLSSEALAVSKEINASGGIFFTLAGADEITGSDCNKVTFRWTVPTYGAIEQTIRPLAKKYPSAKRWYTITPQYVFGEDLLKQAKKVFSEIGVTHVGNSYHSLKDKEFSGYLAEAMAAKPDVLVVLNMGAQSEATIRQAFSFGMKNKMKILLVWSTGLDQLRSLGPDITDGIYMGAQYWHSIDTPANKNLVELTRKQYGINPNYVIAVNYSTTKLIIDAIKEAKSDYPATVIAKLEGYKYKGVTGDEEVRGFDHQVIKNYYLLKGKPKSAMIDSDDFAEIVSYGKSFITKNESVCKMP